MAEVRIDYPKAPRPYQREFHKSRKKIKGIVGGVGAGKTTALCIEIIRLLFEYPNNFVLLLRQDAKRLKLTTLAELLNYIPQSLIEKNDSHAGLITFVNKSQLAYMGLDDVKDAAQKIQSMNLGAIVIDQAEEVSGTTVEFVMKTRLRRIPQIGGYLIFVANDDGRNWIYNKYMKQHTHIEGTKEVVDKHIVGEDYEIWVVNTYDNKENLPADYLKGLEDMPDWWKNRYIYSTMEDWSSAVYNIRANHKIIPITPEGLKDFDLFITGIDYGKTNPSAAVFMAIKRNPFKIVVYDEIYRRNLLISQFATLIKSKVSYWGKIPIFVIDPRTDQSTGIGDGTTVYVDFLNNGINAIPGDNDKLSGILKVNELLQRDQLLYCLNAENTIWEHENYKFKQLAPSRRETHNASEEPEDNNDHTCDALRYVVKYIFQLFGGVIPQDEAKKVASEVMKDYNPLSEIFDDMDKYRKAIKHRHTLSTKGWMA